MARDNAGLALSQRLAERTSLRTRIEALQDALGLAEPPARIECFDISHTRGEATVASCVVFDTQGPLKSDYRRFNIRDVTAGDDYAAIRQALSRRYTRLRREDGKLPDLLMIDGGRGQLSIAVDVLEELQLDDLPIVAVAKGTSRRPGLETLYLRDRPTGIGMRAGSAELRLVQQIRDEAHRFAITGHRTRRRQARRTSRLEEIPGVGAKRRQRLLSEFGGLQAVARPGSRIWRA